MKSSFSRRRLASTAAKMWPRERPTSFGPGPMRQMDLRGHDQLIAWPRERSQRRADELLRFALRVAVGRVDEVHAGVERGADHGLGFGGASSLPIAVQNPFPPKVIVPRHNSET